MKEFHIHESVTLEQHGENDFSVVSEYGKDRIDHVRWTQAASLLGSAIMNYLESNNEFYIAPEPEPEPEKGVEDGQVDEPGA